MPWSNQSGGGGSGGGGGNGPWGQRGTGGGGGPWGGGGQGGGGGKPPDLEDILRRGGDRLRGLVPGSGPVGGRAIAVGLLAVVLIWLATGFYKVNPNEIGLNLVFGRYRSSSANGLSWNWPYPVGTVEKPVVTLIRTIEIGRMVPERGRSRSDALSLMLTGDENIVDIDFTLQWQVDAARVRDFVFNLRDPNTTVRDVAESAMREVIGRRNIQAILTTDRSAIEGEVKQLTQDTLNSYAAGIEVVNVLLQRVDPPQEVIAAFRDVQAARQNQDQVRNEAETYASRVVPEARGEATRITQGAEAYRDRSIAEAKGAASRFDQVLAEYKKAPAVIRERMFIETMERVLSGTDKVLIDGAGSGVVPYLPLNELRRPAQPAPTAQGASR